MTDRRFATPKQRRALWRAADGKCAHCGCDLPSNFHCDHVVPWSATGITNVHQMQALCPTCNIRKGNLMLRAHQMQAIELAEQPQFGTEVKTVLCNVTPGGGKSALPVIFADRMIKRHIAGKVCWVVPRDSLRKQAEHAFLDPFFRRMLGHGREIRATKNETDPTRGYDGYVTTYQAIGADPDLHEHEFRRHRYVLVLDEVHHVSQGSAWDRAIRPLVERAAVVILLSGTLSRSDGEKIAFVDYEMHSNGQQVPVERNTDTLRVIRYSRQMALQEEAVLPIYFERVDGRAKWDQEGVEISVGSLKNIGAQTSQALYTALRQEYAFELLEEMLRHWREYRKFNPHSKFLVVSPTIALAKTYLKRCRELGFRDVDIAVSEESDEAKKNIDRLKGSRQPECAGLVTVAMAYEGLDVPSITHIACLTHIRAHEWIEQMLARATRVDRKAGAYGQQAAYVWAPDDDLFSEAIGRIEQEQAAMIREREATESGGSTERKASEPAPIIPLDAASTVIRAMDMQGGRAMDPEDRRMLRAALDEAGLGYMNVSQFSAAVAAYERQKASGPHDEQPSAPVKTASEREKDLRDLINTAVKQIAKGDGEIIRQINVAVSKHVDPRGCKSRKHMNFDELKRAYHYLERAYRLKGA